MGYLMVSTKVFEIAEVAICIMYLLSFLWLIGNYYEDFNYPKILTTSSEMALYLSKTSQEDIITNLNLEDNVVLITQDNTIYAVVNEDNNDNIETLDTQFKVGRNYLGEEVEIDLDNGVTIINS